MGLGIVADSFNSALKVHYTDDMVARLTLSDHPLLAMVAKYTRFGGKNLPIPIIYGNPQARSVTFSTAQGAAATQYSRVTDFVLTRVKDYSIATIDGETMDASMGDKNAFMEAAVTEIDGAFEAIASSLAAALFRDGSGALDTADADTVTSTAAAGKNWVLGESDNVVHFEVGMVMVLHDGGVGGTVRAGTADSGTSDITAVNRSTGVLTFGNGGATDTVDAMFGSGGGEVGDQLAMDGDNVAAGGTVVATSKVSGLDAWVPSSAPTSTAFFNVNRSVDTDRLGGIRYDGSDEPLEEAYINAATRVSRDGGRVDTFFVNYAAYADLEKVLGAKRVYGEVTVTAEIGFPALVISGPKGPIKVVADQNCPPNVAYGLDMRWWKLYSLGKAPQILDRGNGNRSQIYNADATEIRIGYYAQMGCRAPGRNVRLTLPS